MTAAGVSCSCNYRVGEHLSTVQLLALELAVCNLFIGGTGKKILYVNDEVTGMLIVFCRSNGITLLSNIFE